MVQTLMQSMQQWMSTLPLWILNVYLRSHPKWFVQLLMVWRETRACCAASVTDSSLAASAPRSSSRMADHRLDHAPRGSCLMGAR